MSHHIYAKRPGIDAGQLHERFRITDYDSEGWDHRYREYLKETQIAEISRSFGNPLNQVIYLALGVYDEAYAGSNGSGATLNITLEQLKDAQQVLKTKSFVGMKRPRNGGDELVEMLAEHGVVQEGECVTDTDITQEITFVNRCVYYLEFLKMDSIEVVFS